MKMDPKILTNAERLFELACEAAFIKPEGDAAVMRNLLQRGINHESGERVWGLPESGSKSGQAGGGAKWELERDLGNGLVLRISGHVPQSALKAVAESMEKTPN